jgi:hypothetical protein
MTTSARRWRLAGLILLAAALFGCNPMLLPYFLMPGRDAMKDPLFMSLAPKKGQDHKESKVLILGYSTLDLQPEFVGVDRELCDALAQQLRRGFKENDEKVSLVPTNQVEAYKDKHPDWKSKDLCEIGQHFSADYVIYFEIRSMSFYERGSSNTLYHGRADITIALLDVNDPDSGPSNKDEYICEYPRGDRPLLTEDINPRKFRLDFMNYIAKHLSWYFTAHPLQDDISCE